MKKFMRMFRPKELITNSMEKLSDSINLRKKEQKKNQNEAPLNQKFPNEMSSLKNFGFKTDESQEQFKIWGGDKKKK